MSPPDPWLLCDPYCAQFKCYHEEEIEMNEEPPVTEAELARVSELDALWGIAKLEHYERATERVRFLTLGEAVDALAAVEVESLAAIRAARAQEDGK